jgi:hypothetical protein
VTTLSRKLLDADANVELADHHAQRPGRPRP